MTPNTAAAAGLPANIGLQRARRMFSGEWDANGTTTVHMPASVARDLLEARGWTRAFQQGAWDSPSGDRYWHTDEALAHALASEVL